jgi:hypothetical protein
MARRGSSDAVLVASRALVGVAARSLAGTEDTVTLVQYRALVLLAALGSTNVGASPMRSTCTSRLRPPL